MIFNVHLLFMSRERRVLVEGNSLKQKKKLKSLMSSLRPTWWRQFVAIFNLIQV